MFPRLQFLYTFRTVPARQTERRRRVRDAGAIALAAALKSSPCHLEALGLSGAQLTDAAALAFARVLSSGRSHDGRWKPHGREHDRRKGRQGIQRWNGRASEVAGKGMCTLRRLDLSRNGVTDTGARCVRAAFFITYPCRKSVWITFFAVHGNSSAFAARVRDMLKSLGRGHLRAQKAEATDLCL